VAPRCVSTVERQEEDRRQSVLSAYPARRRAAARSAAAAAHFHAAAMVIKRYRRLPRFDREEEGGMALRAAVRRRAACPRCQQTFRLRVMPFANAR